MYKTYFKLSLVALMAMIVSCSPKYTKSFQPTDYTPYGQLKEGKAKDIVAENNYWSDEDLGLDQLVLEEPQSLSASKEVEVTLDGTSIDDTGERSTQLISDNQLSQDQKSKEKDALKQVRLQMKSMSKEERAKLKEQSKEALAKLKMDDKTTDTDMNLALLVIITILLPPVGMLIYEGGVTNRFWISLLLTLLFYVPGLVYSLVIILGNR